MTKEKIIQKMMADKETADFTAMVSGIVTHENDTWKIYILPHPVNKHLNGPGIVEGIVDLSLMLGDGKPTEMFIENVGIQQAIVDMVNAKGIHAEGFSPAGRDKRARLISISELIKSGRILFPKRGAEKLIQQVLWFGMEKHDDLVDALTTLVLSVFEREEKGKVVIPKLEKPIPPTTQELEQKADFDLIYEQGIRRGLDPRTAKMMYQVRKSQKESRDYWAQEEQAMYNAMMQRYRNQ
jgi:predicted phage terminase large subunit-like protein